MPAAAAVTSTRTLQFAPAAMLPALNASEAAPATGANVGAPQLVVLAFGGVATTIAPGTVGSVSEKPTPVMPAAVELLSVKTSVVTPPGAIGFARNALAIVAAPTLVVRVVTLLVGSASKVVPATVKVVATLLVPAAIEVVTGTLSVGRLAPTTRLVVVFVQTVGALPAQLQPLPNGPAPTSVRPAGKENDTVNAPLALCGPLLRTFTAYEALPVRAMLALEAVALITRSANLVMPPRSESTTLPSALLLPPLVKFRSTIVLVPPGEPSRRVLLTNMMPVMLLALPGVVLTVVAGIDGTAPGGGTSIGFCNNLNSCVPVTM